MNLHTHTQTKKMTFASLGFTRQVCAVRWLSTPGGKHDLGHAKRRSDATRQHRLLVRDCNAMAVFCFGLFGLLFEHPLTPK